MSLDTYDMQQVRIAALTHFLLDRYPPITITPRSRMEEIQFAGGQQEVVRAIFEFLERPLANPNRLTAAEQMARK